MADFVDTNILLYSIGGRLDETPKCHIARNIHNRGDPVLPVQVLREFHVQAARASRPEPLSHELSVDLIGAWCRFHIEANSVAVMNAALKVRAETGFNYRDCAMIAAAQIAECGELLTGRWPALVCSPTSPSTMVLQQHSWSMLLWVSTCRACCYGRLRSITRCCFLGACPAP